MNCYVLDGHEPRLEPDLLRWATWFNAADLTVRLTEQGDVQISTVFLGIDHGFGPGPPVLFETMVFVAGDDVGMRRYSTWDEAALGHDAMVKAVFHAAVTKARI